MQFCGPLRGWLIVTWFLDQYCSSISNSCQCKLCDCFMKAICHFSLCFADMLVQHFFSMQSISCKSWYLCIRKMLSLAYFFWIRNYLMNEVQPVPKWKPQILYFVIVSGKYKNYPGTGYIIASFLEFQLWNIWLLLIRFVTITWRSRNLQRSSLLFLTLSRRIYFLDASLYTMLLKASVKNSTLGL